MAVGIERQHPVGHELLDLPHGAARGHVFRVDQRNIPPETGDQSPLADQPVAQRATLGLVADRGCELLEDHLRPPVSARGSLPGPAEKVSLIFADHGAILCHMNAHEEKCRSY